MVICLSCGLDSGALSKKAPLHIMRKDEDGQYHWKECHRVGGKVNANISIYSLPKEE